MRLMVQRRMYILANRNAFSATTSLVALAVSMSAALSVTALTIIFLAKLTKIAMFIDKAAFSVDALARSVFKSVLIANALKAWLALSCRVSRRTVATAAIFAFFLQLSRTSCIIQCS